MLEELKKHTEISFDTETTGIDANDAELVGLSFCVRPGQGWYVPVPAKIEETKAYFQNLQHLFNDESKNLDRA